MDLSRPPALRRGVAEASALAWSDGAACKGRIDLFFAPHGERPQARERREEEGRRVCGACPVREPCREHARHHLELGLWGGETEAERALTR